MPDTPPPLPSHAASPALPSHAALHHPPLAPKSRNPTLKILLIIGGLILAGFLCIAAYVIIYLKTAKDYKLTDEQELAILTAEDVAEWFEIDLESGAAEWEVQQFFDKSKQIFCYYTGPDLTLDCTITVEMNFSDTTASYLAEWHGMKLGNGLGEETIGLEDANELFTWGDTSKFAFQVHENERIGMTFITRSGNKIYFVDVYGVVLETNEEIDEFLRPKLEYFEATEF